MNHKLKVGVLGATGMVGQRFISLLNNHPWFEVTLVAASPRSANKTYSKAVKGRWCLESSIPESVANLIVKSVEDDFQEISNEVDFVFSALDMDKSQIRLIEEKYAAADIPVISNNSAHRWTEDVPMIIPEINPDHCELIDIQRKNRNWKKGFITAKPNCSIQTYVPVLKALELFKPEKVLVTTMQAISGAGKTFKTWPEMIDNVIPLINGEEDKSEKEPLKVLGKVNTVKIDIANDINISSTCIRVPVSDGHMASVSLKFQTKPSKEEFINSINYFTNPISELNLHSAPQEFIKYFAEDDRPQTKMDRNFGKGMGVSVGRLREDIVMDWKFVCLSHNTIRGAAGGAILMAELLKAKGYLY